MKSSQIYTLLCQLGYCTFSGAPSGILIKDTEEYVYSVVLSSLESRISLNSYCEIERNVTLLAAGRYGKPVRVLHIIMAENGMFDDATMELVKYMSNVWLLALDTGRIYVFENQSTDFGGLYENLIVQIAALRKKQSIFPLTPVNTMIVFANLFVFAWIVLQYGFDAVYDTELMLRMGAMDCPTVTSGEWYRLISSMFFHFGFAHLANNMVLLLYVGYELERRIGSLFYTLVYFFAGILGNVASFIYYSSYNSHVVSAGASGAIFGVIGALIICLIINRGQRSELSPRSLVALTVVTIYYGLTTVGVDNAAHIGGLLGGMVGGFLLSKRADYGKLK